jgi:hypothetical protein
MHTQFIKIGADGAQLPADANDHAAVLDQRTGLIWSANAISDQRLTYAEAKKACEKLALAGSSDWRLPEVEELFALCDRTRFSPAIDTEAFPGVDSSWFWTATVDAEAPSSFAWSVSLHYGYASFDFQLSSGRVLACRRAARASQ